VYLSSLQFFHAYHTSSFADLSNLKFSFRFTKGNIVPNFEKLAAFQTSHLKHLLNQEHPDMPVLEEALLEPMANFIQEIELKRNAAISETIKSATGEMSLNISDLGSPITEMGTTDSAMKYLFATYKSNAKRYSAAQDLIIENPSLFWRIKPEIYERNIAPLINSNSIRAESGVSEQFSHKRSKEIDLRQIFNLIQSKISGLEAENWTESNLQGLLEQSILPEIAQTGMPNSSAVMYGIIRYALLGIADAPSKPAKVQLCLLGKDEVLDRFGVARQAWDAWKAKSA
jgi:hypothetical protein